MKRALTVLLVALAASVLLTPAFAAYTQNWYTGFEPPTYQPGPLAGQDGWVTPDTYYADVSMDVVAGAGIGGGQCVVQRDGYSSNAKDMRYLNNGYAFNRGYAKFWVYDPGYNSALGLVDARVGLHSSAANDGINYLATAQIEDISSRDPNYWYAQWSYSVAKLDGATQIASGEGYTFTQGPAAPRVWGAWSYVLIDWLFIPGFSGNPDTGVINWRINQSSVSPNLTLNFDSTSGRWNNFHDVAGLFAGSFTYSNSRPAKYDNFEFHFVPEPSGILALGAGLIGLLGLIRRRR